MYSHGSGEWSSIAKDTDLECVEVEEGDIVELTKSFVYKVTSIISKVVEGEREKDLPDEESIAGLGNNLENQDPEEEAIKPLPTGVMGTKKKKRELPNWMKENLISPKKSKTAASLPSALNQKYLDNVKFLNSGPTLNQTVKEEPEKNEMVKTTSPYELSDDDNEEAGSKLVTGRLNIVKPKGEPLKQAAKENKKAEFRRSPFDYTDEEVRAPAGSSCLKLSEYAEYIRLQGNPPAEGKIPKAEKRESSSKADVCLEQGSVEDAKEFSFASQEDDNFTFPVLITQEDVQDDDTKEDAKQATARRPSCAYGASCYRKNPAHRKDTAHPGDHDFKDITDQV